MIHVSVVVICYNEERNIAACLDALLRQTYPVDRHEIVVVDGGSTDRTAAIIRSYADAHARVRLTSEPRIGTSFARNAGVAAARHPHIAFIDADCLAAPEWLEQLAAHFVFHRDRDPSVVAVGGGNQPPSNSPPFVLAIGLALDSYVGSFRSAQGRRFSVIRYVKSLANLNALYLKAAITETGGYDNSLGNVGEDADLNHRLSQQGWSFVWVPDLSVLHRFRSTPALWFRNMVRYGRGRARLLIRHPELWSPAYGLPPLFLVGMAALLLTPWHPIFWMPGLYFPAMLLVATRICLRAGRASLIGQVFLVLVVQHVGYAMGETWEWLYLKAGSWARSR
ncbi:MAG: glycosyltransferase [Magnetococcales bacterium]|nr:glycosyltransferase [Magnetococcales bacterium]MBF0116785.1 glycosyltransferase [Magnetococcales bacterium]